MLPSRAMTASPQAREIFLHYAATFNSRSGSAGNPFARAVSHRESEQPLDFVRTSASGRETTRLIVLSGRGAQSFKQTLETLIGAQPVESWHRFAAAPLRAVAGSAPLPTGDCAEYVATRTASLSQRFKHLCIEILKASGNLPAERQYEPSRNLASVAKRGCRKFNDLSFRRGNPAQGKVWRTCLKKQVIFTAPEEQ